MQFLSNTGLSNWARAFPLASMSVLLACAVTSQASPLSADTALEEIGGEVMTEVDFNHQVQPIESVSFLAQVRAQAPASVTVLDRAFIDAAPATSITDLFRLVPGFQSYFVNAGRAAVNYHAMGDSYPRRMEVKIDDRSVYESIFTSVIWSSLGIQLEDVERIEIVRGSNAASEGSNAFLGSVNIVTRSPANSGGSRISLSQGTDGIGSVTASQSGNFKEISYRLAANYQRQDGFDDVVGVAMDDSAEGDSANLRMLWTPNIHNTLDFHFGISNDRIGVGEDDEFATHYYRGGFQKINWTLFLGNGDQWSAMFYHNSLHVSADQSKALFSSLLLDEGVPEVFLPSILADYPDRSILVDFDDTQSDRWEMELHRTFNLSAELRAVLGGSWRLDTAKSELLFGRKDQLRRETARGFGSVEWNPYLQWTFNASGSFENASSQNNYGSMRIGVNYQQSDKAIWRLTASRGERQGSLLETDQSVGFRYSETVMLDAKLIAGDDLQTEKLDAFEFGYNRSWQSDRLQLDARWFYEDYDDMISSRREFYADEQREPEFIYGDIEGSIALDIDDSDRRVGVRRNATNIVMRGYEVQLSYRPSSRWLVNASWTDFDITGYAHKYQWVEDYFALQYYRTPRASRSALVSYRFDNGWQLATSVYYQGRAKWLDGNDTEPYLRADAQLSRHWEISQGRKIKLSLLAQNLGEDYTEFYTTNQFSTRYIVMLQWLAR